MKSAAIAGNVKAMSNEAIKDFMFPIVLGTEAELSRAC
jgi:hypothetical protein